MNVIIRLATIGDASAISELSEQLGYNISETDTRKYMELIRNNNNDVVYVAELNGAVAGWMQVFYTVRIESAPFCEIAGLVVNEQYRGMGIGKTLIEYGRNWAAERCHCLKVRTNVLREKTHRFYEGAGFTEVKEQKIYEMKL
ncbi:GNAT family N-acetyltransferase [Chitinophagaceae bacterium MMS25-I14]